MYFLIYRYIKDEKSKEIKRECLDIAKDKEQKEAIKRYNEQKYHDIIYSKVISAYDITYYEYLIKNNIKD